MYLYVADLGPGLMEGSKLLLSAFSVLLALHDFLRLWWPWSFRLAELDSGGFPLEASEAIHFFSVVLLLDENMEEELAFSFLLCSHGYIDLGLS